MSRPKKPTVDQRLAALEITTNLMMKSVDRSAAQLLNLKLAIERIDRGINQEQVDQLALAVNKIAAYAAAMDDTKKEMIKLTSARINKLQQRVDKLRVRLTRLEG